MPTISKDNLGRNLTWFLVVTALLCLGIAIGMIVPVQHKPARIQLASVPAYPPPAPIVEKVEPPPPAEPPKIIAPEPIPLTIINPLPKIEEAATPVVQRSKATERMLKCLQPKMRQEWDKIEAKFGPLKVTSTCNHSYYVAGSRRMSLHVVGKAVDFLPGKHRDEILGWLLANYHDGLIMTYPNSDHIHIDIGHYGGAHFAARDANVTVSTPAERRTTVPVSERIKPLEKSAKPMHRVAYRHVRDCDDWEDWD